MGGHVQGASLGLTWPLALAALLAVAPASAQESLSVKELLGRAQTKPQTEAVEDLIRKLKGGERAPGNSPEPQLPAAAKTDPVAVAPPPSDPTPAAKAGSASEGGQAETPVDRPPAQATAPPAPVPMAETPQAPPSVDLEVHFEYKSARITPPAVDLLTVLGRALSDERLAGETFLIAGHTDAKGGATYNLQLSQARADAVREFLITQFGIAPGRLVAEGHGYRQLKDPRMPFAAVNRRVQVTNTTRQTARP